MDNYEYMSDEWIDNFNKPKGKDSFFEFTDMNKVFDPELDKAISSFKNADDLKKFRDRHYDKENSSWNFGGRVYPIKSKAKENIEAGKKPLSEVLDKNYVSDEQKLMESVNTSIEQKAPITDEAKELGNKILKDNGLPYKESSKSDEVKEVPSDKVSNTNTTTDTNTNTSTETTTDVDKLIESIPGDTAEEKIKYINDKYQKYNPDDPIYRSAVHALTSDYLTPKEKISLFGSVIANLVANTSSGVANSLDQKGFTAHTLPWKENYMKKVLENAAASDSKVRESQKTAEAEYAYLMGTLEGAEKVRVVLDANPGLRNALLDYLAMNPKVSYKDAKDLVEKAGLTKNYNVLEKLYGDTQVAGAESNLTEERNRGKASDINIKLLSQRLDINEYTLKKLAELTPLEIQTAKNEIESALYQQLMSREISKATYDAMMNSVDEGAKDIGRLNAAAMYGQAQWNQNTYDAGARFNQHFDKVGHGVKTGTGMVKDVMSAYAAGATGGVSTALERATAKDALSKFDTSNGQSYMQQMRNADLTEKTSRAKAYADGKANLLMQ